MPSGYFIEFNRETSSGLIEEATTKRIVSVHLNDIKQRSRRYFTENNEFIGESFDFDVLTKQNTNGEETFEAKNVRHHVLYCSWEDCSRLKAFTNKKALDDHINIRHILKEEKRRISATSTIVEVDQPKKERRIRLKPFTICLSFDTSDAVIGRFIGKQGVNIKRFEEKHPIRIQLLDSQNQYKSIQIRIKPKSRAMFDRELITTQLKLKWERCVHDQKRHEQEYFEQLRLKYLNRGNRLDYRRIEIASDSRHANHFKFLETKRSKMQKLIQQAKQNQIIQFKNYRSCGFNRNKKDMKNHQWKVNEQLKELA